MDGGGDCKGTGWKPGNTLILKMSLGRLNSLPKVTWLLLSVVVELEFESRWSGSYDVTSSAHKQAACHRRSRGKNYKSNSDKK